MSRRFILWSVVLLAVGCTGRGSLLNQPRSEPSPVIVKVQRAVPGSAATSTGYVGTVASSRTATLTAPAAGTLVSLPVREGGRVWKGQTVAQIESQAVSSAYDAAASRLAQAEDGWSRVQKVYASGTVTEVDYIRVKTQLDEARAMEAAARSALERCTLKAPISGVVEKVYLTEGVETVPAEPVVRIVDLGTLEIRFPLPENEFPYHTVGEKVEVEIPALAYKGPGVLRNKGIAASALSHSYECTVSLSGGITGLMPGMVCKVFLPVKAADSIVIPSSAVMTDMEGRFVWTATGGIVDKKHVTVGGYSGAGILISEGLSPEDLIIVEGARKVSVGMKVQAQE